MTIKLLTIAALIAFASPLQTAHAGAVVPLCKCTILLSGGKEKTFTRWGDTKVYNTENSVRDHMRALCNGNVILCGITYVGDAE